MVAKNDPRRMERMTGIRDLDGALAIDVTMKRLADGGYDSIFVKNFKKKWVYNLITYAGQTDEGIPVWHMTPKGLYCDSLLRNMIPPNLLS